ncbi:MAG: sirohydrochlorin chelatase, partial [Nitrospinota bacterium]
MKKAILLLGHGSRIPEANEGMYRVSELVRNGGRYPIVEAAFLELTPPNIQEGIDLCVQQGAEKIIMIPYFLHLGAHVQEDLPREVEQARQRHPGLEVVLGPHLG